MKIDRLRSAIRAGVLVLLVLLATTVVVLAVEAMTAWPIALGAALLAVAGYLAAARLERWLPRRIVLDVDLEREIVELVPANPVGRLLAAEALVLRDVVDALRRAAADRRVVGLVARVGPGAPGLAQAQDIRDAIAEFRAAGKPAVAFAETFGEDRTAMIGYYLATAFDEIHLLPTADVMTTGLHRRRPFLRGLLDRLGVVPDVGRRREYKSAADIFTETEMSPPFREAEEALVGSQYDQIVAGIAAGRGLDEAAVRAAIDGAPLLAGEALSAGLVDGLSYRDEVYERAKERGKLVGIARYLERAGRPDRKGAGVALIYGVGPVVRKGGGLNPFQPGYALSSDDVGAAFRAAVKDRKVKAIVFRIDSPGGSAVASEVVWREVARAREAGKPVVASFGNVAASGGYYVAAGADHIVCQPGTVTGSIGVVTGKLVDRAAWEKTGVRFDEVHAGEHAAMWSADRPFTDGERARLEAGLDAVYDAFKARVETGRSLTPAAVEAAARGRVWAGDHAHRLGLVDELGGLARAVGVAAAAADLDRVRVVVMPRRKRTDLLRRRRPEPDALAALVRQAVAAVRGPVPGSGVPALWYPGSRR